MKRIKVGDIQLYVREDTVDDGVAGEVILGDCYQLNHIGLREYPNIVDVGAHIGSFTLFAANRWPGARIWAYEANQNNWDILKRNVSHLKDRVTVYEGACVGVVPANKRLIIAAHEKDKITGGWGINFTTQVFDEPETVATQEIENFYSLSEVLGYVDKIDILKMDCEGSEFSILSALTDQDLYHIDYIVAEVHCGATSHTPIGYQEFRSRILKQFICPQLEARPNPGNHALFNIVACNRKLIPR